MYRYGWNRAIHNLEEFRVAEIEADIEATRIRAAAAGNVALP